MEDPGPFAGHDRLIGFCAISQPNSNSDGAPALKLQPENSQVVELLLEGGRASGLS